MSASKYILITLMYFITMQMVIAQDRNKLLMAHDHMILLIDTRSSMAVIDSLLKRAGVTGMNAALVKKGNFSLALKNGWNVSRKKNDVIEFDRSLGDMSANPPASTYIITTQLFKTESRPGYPAETAYGVNSFKKVTVHELPTGATRFFFPGHTNARRVLLSGNFNNWSTIKGRMNKTDSGWVSDVKLNPGIYAYKFIVDGDWTEDQYNNLREDDGFGGSNSLYFRYNYTFKLKGYKNAHKVSIAGSFNKWNPRELNMSFNGEAWQINLYLHDGIFLYRFMVDGNWIADPYNKLTHGEGKTAASVLKLGETINFKLNGYAKADHVYVAGDFTNWKPNILALQKTANGWALPYTLPAGNYLYKFVVNGEWITDPANPHQITIDGNTNSFIAVKPNFTFKLRGYATAHKVILSGTFNNWNETGYTMQHQGDEWVISLYLKPDKYLYKFIVDGQWIIDPANRLWEPNAENTGNSVLWID